MQFTAVRTNTSEDSKRYHPRGSKIAGDRPLSPPMPLKCCHFCSFFCLVHGWRRALGSGALIHRFACCSTGGHYLGRLASVTVLRKKDSCPRNVHDLDERVPQPSVPIYACPKNTPPIVRPQGRPTSHISSLRLPRCAFLRPSPDNSFPFV